MRSPHFRGSFVHISVYIYLAPTCNLKKRSRYKGDVLVLGMVGACTYRVSIHVFLCVAALVYPTVHEIC